MLVLLLFTQLLTLALIAGIWKGLQTMATQADQLPTSINALTTAVTALIAAQQPPVDLTSQIAAVDALTAQVTAATPTAPTA